MGNHNEILFGALLLNVLQKHKNQLCEKSPDYPNFI